MPEEGIKSPLDPTPRTMEFSHRESEAIRELINEKFLNVQSINEGTQRAIELLQSQADRQPQPIENKLAIEALKELVEAKIGGLKELIQEMLKSVQTQFEQNKVALDAALNAAKEAVSEQNKSNTLAINKSEDAFKKLLETSGTRVDATEKATDGKIADIKDRVTAIEGRTNGVNEQKQEVKDNRSLVFGLIGAGGVIIGTIIAVGSILAARLP